ncbi:MAG: hypothetical protein WA996_11440 [Candidatus Promineifilaceae bacterium]
MDRPIKEIFAKPIDAEHLPEWNDVFQDGGLTSSDQAAVGALYMV